MKYEIKFTTRFKKDYKIAQKRNLDINLLHELILLLASGNPLPERYKDHALTGNYQGARECHIKPDWLLIYNIYEDILVLELMRTGTHSDLF
ncbi:MAG: type II toxin-antitoxin system YafQ family toxin [Kiritimatiellae bacterium]|nr:type II toxin-antitoxin system YafQ family toxin [Kiritimatiellia bacterium]